MVIFESALAVARIRVHPLQAAKAAVSDFFRSIEAEIMPIDAAIGAAAIDAFARYGKGRHPAALNMGDCFTYACAQSGGLPLLCKGDDFRRTDLALA